MNTAIKIIFKESFQGITYYKEMVTKIWKTDYNL